MSRPSKFANYDNPPLNEVVLGVQFSPPRGYQQIYAGEVWELFKKDFPKTRELQALSPTFETFGGIQESASFNLVAGACHDRFWFISENEEELIQFQHDRLLHNWRKVGKGENPYPRFETILPKFESELTKLEKYLSKFSSGKMNITQCELNYINHIVIQKEEDQSADKWLRLIDFSSFEPNDFSLKFRQEIHNEEGTPCGRLIGEAKNILNKKRESIIHLTLSVRGLPQRPDVSSAITFIKEGHERILNCFDNISTEFAHTKWGKK